MIFEDIHRIVILGTGNVATHLSLALKSANLDILQVYGRNLANTKVLANNIGTPYTNEIISIDPSADLYIVCISDDALDEFVSRFHLKNAFIVHTSGTASIEIFKEDYQNCGAFYPLQTFSKEKRIRFDNVPLCIEANNNINQKLLLSLARKLTTNIQITTHEQRTTLHVAAVFASNFTNHFYSIANEILSDKQLSFDLLKPLIRETAEKVQSISPDEAQTGPAKRNDLKVRLKHIEKLAGFSEYQKIYNYLSSQIQKKYN
ncbi:MAG: DUF2520 domain-containing protein [Bacteroidetes bacterium]|nr:DUF2520 domain-containing protein [Bacteroidota bacterium]